MSEIQLRPYQWQGINDIHNEFALGFKRVVFVAPCGAGKTVMTGWMIREALKRGKKSIFFVHRKELIDQTSETFSRLDIEHGIIASGVPMNLDLPVQIASVQTLARRLNDVPKPDFLICDECHHILANTYQKIIDKFPDAFLLGVTATPQRMGGINLCDTFTAMVESLTVDELIARGNLTRFNYFAPNTAIDLSRVKLDRFGEYDNRQIARIMSRGKIIGNIVNCYKKHAEDKSAICYCVNVNHSKTVAVNFRNAGITAAHVDAKTPKAERNYIVEQFRRGEIKILCNAELFGEGFDVPHCQAVILARPTKSLTLYIQQAMRPLRPDPDDPNKVAVIIDHVQNCARFGLPNARHEWSLDPNPPKITGNAPVKTCPECELVVPLSTRECPECGHVFFVEVEPVEEVGELVAVNVTHNATHNATHNVNPVKHKPTFVEEFLAIAERKNYKRGWAAIQALKYADSYDACLHIAETVGYKPGWAWYQWQKINSEEITA